MAKPCTFTFATDSATLAVFDIDVARQYKYHEYHDWWTLWECALLATNAGEIAIVDLGCDGIYTIDIVNPDRLVSPPHLTINIRCPSGKLYVCPGEDIPAGGLEPDETCSGKLIQVEGVAVRCHFRRVNDTSIQVALEVHTGDATNNFTQPTRLS